jgi:hypothetical protein
MQLRQLSRGRPGRRGAIPSEAALAASLSAPAPAADAGSDGRADSQRESLVRYFGAAGTQDSGETDGASAGWWWCSMATSRAWTAAPPGTTLRC